MNTENHVSENVVNSWLKTATKYRHFTSKMASSFDWGILHCLKQKFQIWIDYFDICLTLKEILPILAKLAIRTQMQMTKGSSTRSKSNTTSGYLSVWLALCSDFSLASARLNWHKIIHVHRQTPNKENPARDDITSISTWIPG